VNPATAVAIGLVIIGTLAAAPGLVLLGLLTVATARLSTLWSTHGLDDVRYERRLASERAVWGDSVELTISIENGKLLPLAWIEADDFTTDTTTVREQTLTPSTRPGYAILRNLWSLAPFEVVRRQFHLEAARRGLYRFESVRLSVADLFGRGVAENEETRGLSFLVRPRTVPVRTASGSVVTSGTRAARRGLIEDPSLFAGVRPFQLGDPRRRVHERATARLGRPVSKRYEPSTAREVMIALDVTTHDGPIWLLAYDDELVESLIVAAASLARRLLTDGAACGLAVNGWTYSLARRGFVPPHAGLDQLARITDLLGRTSSHPSMPFAWLLAELPTRLSNGALIVTVSSRDPIDVLPPLRRLRSSGHEIRHISLGPEARVHAQAATRLGIAANMGRLEPDWRTSDALVLAT
jgi:uncharacterized protein (DUF58 family)